LFIILNVGISGKLDWIGNWITYIDTMLQFSILGLKTKELYLPTRMQRVIIDPAKHLEYIETLPENSRKCFLFDTYCNIIYYNKYFFKCFSCSGIHVQRY